VNICTKTRLENTITIPHPHPHMKIQHTTNKNSDSDLHGVHALGDAVDDGAVQRVQPGLAAVHVNYRLAHAALAQMGIDRAVVLEQRVRLLLDRRAKILSSCMSTQQSAVRDDVPSSVDQASHEAMSQSDSGGPFPRW